MSDSFNNSITFACLELGTLSHFADNIWSLIAFTFYPFREEGRGHSRFWQIVMWVDDALKPLFYMIFAVPCFLFISPVLIVCGMFLPLSFSTNS